MAIPYRMIKVLEGKEPSFLKESTRDPKSEAKFLMKNRNMKGYYLGDCLDSCRWGSMTTIRYEMNYKEMIYFVQNWMHQNKNNLQNLFHERKISDRFELPYIDHKTCPIGKDHKETVIDLGGRLRCAHKTINTLKPSFVNVFEGFDTNSQTRKISYYELKPADPEEIQEEIQDDIDDEEYEYYKKEFEKWEEEEPTLIVEDYCYAILSDRRRVLSLETIINRLNLEPTQRAYCRTADGGCSPKRLKQMSRQERENYLDVCFGHTEPNDYLVFPFDGWDLAFYVQKWYEQLPNGKALLFNN